jgi:hypothetical protein
MSGWKQPNIAIVDIINDAGVEIRGFCVKLGEMLDGKNGGGGGGLVAKQQG